MKKNLIKLIFLFSIIFLFSSCNDPIFFTVFKEIPIIKPLIDGSPTNFVRFKNDMYVASGKKIFIFREKTTRWVEWNRLGDYIGSLAATEDSLYVFYLLNNNGRIRRFNNTGSVDLPITNVQSIYASGKILFISRRVNNEEYSFSYFDEDNSSEGVKRIPDTTSEGWLNGVASDNTYYYLCTNEGIFFMEKSLIASSSDLPILGKNFDFTGIINLNNNCVAAITNDGDLFQIENKIMTRKARFSDRRNSTGALALWYENNGTTPTAPSLLLVGRKEIIYSVSTGYSNGYIEITLDNTGRISGSGFKDPGEGSPSSIDSYDRYVSSLGKNPINHMMQAPYDIDKRMTLFASTQQNGVWSYKDRGDGELWNAER